MNRIIHPLLLVMLLLMQVFPVHAADITVVSPQVEHLTKPLGIDVTVPRFSWKTTATRNDVVQTGYEILVASSEELLARDRGDLWATGWVPSDAQLWVPYGGQPLTAHQRAYWKVRVTTNRGRSAWSAAQRFSIGLLGETQWTGRWIGLEELQEGERRGIHPRLAARYLRREFKAAGQVKRATAYVAGFGLYEFFINGQKVGDNQVLMPAPTDYRKTILYNTYDVTSLLAANNAVGITLAAGRVFPMRQEKYYKAPVFGLPKCRVNILVEYADGKRETWSTDERWKVTTQGPVRTTNEYDGEEYDARMRLTGWNTVGYDDSQWQPADRAAIPDGTLRAQMTPPMREQAYGKPRTLTRRTGGSVILDFGQNMAGWVGMHITGRRGDTIRVKYAERLNADGSLYRDNLRNALSEDIYVCDGTERRTFWKPSFVYHGFRYAEVSGLSGATRDDFLAYCVDDEMEHTGTFETSDTILNKIWNNAFWGIRSNYKGMPIDCPQRNERQPWLGDRTVGSLGESFLFDNERLYTKWMRDICEAQRSDGCIPDVAPAFWNYYTDNMTWPAALPFGCDMLYRQYGNMEPIVASYPAMKKWMEHMLQTYGRDGILTKDRYGDWCVPPEKLTITSSKDPARQTSGELIATAYGVRVMQLMEKFAALQHLDDDAALWKARHTAMADAFNRRFLTVRRGTSPRPGHVLYPDSVYYGNNTATANLLPLAFGIVPDSVKEEVVKQVVNNIITVGNGHVTSGVIGISWLMRGLSDNGFSEVAWMLATSKTYPSWGYMTENGATTIWELWNGDKANPSMNSGNHVMLLGDLLTWCYQYVGGIRQAEGSVAYKHLVLNPDSSIPDCFYANTSYVTPYGKVVSRWKKDGKKVHWEVKIPVNTDALLIFPDKSERRLGSGRYAFDVTLPMSNDAVLEEGFLYDFAPFPQAHASTITELKNGDLLAAYFGGTKEKNPDVCIWVSRKPKGADRWEAPVMAGDGTDDYLHQPLSSTALPRQACWNPVLFTMPDGEVWLFFKIAAEISDWQGWVVKSKDGGRTWSKREMLPKGFIGPVKNKPVLVGNRLICGSSTEGDWWRFHVEIYDLATKTWKYVGPIAVDSAMQTDDQKMHPIRCIQPSVLKLRDGRLMVLMRTHNGKLAKSYSSDNGDSWTLVMLSEVENNQSGTDAVTLKDGRQALIYNNFETLMSTKKGPRTPLSLAISDDGEHWHHALTLEDSPVSQYSYPAIIQGRDGNLYCTYTWRRERIAFKKIDLRQLK